MKAVSVLVLCVATLGVTVYGAARPGHILRRHTRLAGSAIGSRAQFPWHTLLSYKDPVDDDKSFICSGALISSSWVVSVATCEIGDTELKDTTALLGAIFREPQDVDPHHQVISVASRTRHPEWSVLSTDNDIALYKLAQPAEITEYVKPVRLPARRLVEATFVDQTLSVSGWGLRKQETTETEEDDEATQSPDEFYSTTLTFIDVEVVRNMNCKDAIGLPLVSRTTGMCASAGIAESGSMGACLGDAGDPAVFLETDDQFTLVGLVSMASAAPCDTGRPTALTRVTAFLDWIQQVTDVPVEE